MNKKFTTCVLWVETMLFCCSIVSCSQPYYKHSSSGLYPISFEEIIGKNVVFNNKNNCWYCNFVENDSALAHAVISVNSSEIKIIVNEAINPSYVDSVSLNVFYTLRSFGEEKGFELASTRFYQDPKSPFIQTAHFFKNDSVIMLYKSRSGEPWKDEDKMIGNDWGISIAQK